MRQRRFLIVTCVSFVLLCVFCGEGRLVAGATAQQDRPPDFEKKMKALESFEAGVQPLFVLGDLNEDGAVDAADLQLLKQAVAGDKRASCLAAGDLDRNGVIDSRDVAILQSVLQQGAIDAPALAYSSPLPCEYRNFFIAAAAGVRPGGALPIHFLDPRFTVQNSSVSVMEGQASVSSQGTEFLVRVPAAAALGSQVTVRITLSGRRSYLYTFSVAGPQR
jgi:hypothetical protein